MKSIKSDLIILAAFLVSLSCDGKNAVSMIVDVPYKAEEEEMSGKMVLKSASYPVGCAVSSSLLRTNKDYRETVAREFSSITPVNEMKLTYVLKNGVYDETTGKWTLTLDFTDADLIVNFAKANNIRVHGHTLVWFKKVPDCLLAYDGKGREIWVSFLKEYIFQVAGHFKGKVASWDVVNEALADDQPNLRGESANQSVKNKDKWFDNIGKDYLNLAFQYAHESDPDALLFYNDYGTEWLGHKRGAMVTLAKRLISEGAPINGIGLQMHTDIEANEEKLLNRIKNIEKNIDVVVGCGLMVHVSEIDVKICKEGETIDYDNTVDLVRRFEDQTRVYKAVCDKLKSYPAEMIFGMTTWGVQDTGSYGKTYKTLLFDENFEKKRAYYGIIETF